MSDWNRQTDEMLDAIAIIGMVGRFPGAHDVVAFWQNIRDGVESVTFFSDEALLGAGVDAALLGKPNYVKAKGIVEAVDQFDAGFFGFSPREAAVLDPQHRLFLECAWAALEQAGYDAPRFAGRIGVFAGVGANSYLYNNLLLGHNRVQPDEAISDSFPMFIGNDKDFVPTRVSYHLNLTGPSVNVNTACSSSLVAVSMAVHSLLSYQCDMVLAGGVAIDFPQQAGYLSQEGMILSPDGHCRAFDAKAQGTVGGSGVGIVVLKRLAEALAAGDTIHAVIRGCAINNDGSNKISYTAPSVEGQAAAIAEALAMANVSPATISYIETHGTGTPLGDPIEIAALTEAFRGATQATQFCALGSVKTNIGHADTAAGVAGLIKTVQALKHRQLPPSLHYSRPNPAIDFANSPFYVNHKLQAWPNGATPRRAGVSSFGIGGTNAHVVLEEAPPCAASSASRTWQLLPLSAKTPTALARMVGNLAEHLRAYPDLKLADVAFTLTNRRPFTYRHTLVAQSVNDAITQAVGGAHTVAQEAPRVAFLFSGQGAQYLNMGRGLYTSEPIFQAAVDRCAELLAPHLGFDLRTALYPEDKNTIEDFPVSLSQTVVAQPALFTIEHALAQLWMAWGIQPVALLGHSIGEYVAACLAGVFSLEDALALVAARGQLMQRLPEGAMLAVSLAAEAITTYLNDSLALAAINEADRCVVAGTLVAVAALETRLTAAGVTCRRLQTSHAFHSPMMEPILDAFTARVAQVTLYPPTKAYVSNITGNWITVEDATSPAYWARHLRETVRFADGLTTISSAVELMLEVGPGHTLATFARHHAALSAVPIFTSLHRPRAEQPDVAHLLHTLGQLWRQGVTIDWEAYYAEERRHRLPLPTYPFERQRYWIEPALPTAQSSSSTALLLQRQPMEKWCYASSWKHVPKPRHTLSTRESWLLFNDDAGLGDELAAALRAAGQTVITVQRGSGFAQPADDRFVMNPTERQHYIALLQSLLRTTPKLLPQKIVHLWNVSGVAMAEQKAAEVDSFYSLLYLAQTLGDLHVTDALDLFVVANHLHNVTGRDTVQPAKALLHGPTRVLPQEYGNITCRSVDIEWPATTTVTHLLAELTATTGEAVVAYRGARRWVSYAEPLQLADTAPPIRTGGVYLITGGLGGIGLTLAQTLARWGTKLVLLGRSAFPAREDWTAFLTTHEADDPISHKICQIQKLEHESAEVLVRSANVADPAAMQAVITETVTRFGQLHGVIHAAGIGGDNIISKTSQEKLEAVLAPKVMGTLVLHDLLCNMPLDFFVVCSSLTALLGGLGQVAYTAANGFQDAFAQSGAFSGAALSINWDAWRDVGMAAYQFTAEENDDGLSPAEGCRLFLQALASGLPQVIVSTQVFEPWLHRHPQAHETLPTSRQRRRAELAAAYMPPRTPTERWLADIWQNYSGIDQIGIEDDFFSHLAGDSLGAMGLINRIQEQLDAIVHLQAIFEAPTIAQMAAFLERDYADALRTRLGLAVDAPQRETETPQHS